MKIIQFNKHKNKYKNQHQYEYMHRLIDYANENGIGLALCFKIEDVDELFCDIDKNFKIQVVTMSEDITDRLSNINYIDLNDLEC